MKAASDNLVPLTLELGGKSPAIVGRGHVNSRTMTSIAYGKLSNGGQTCVAPDYALVHEDDLEAFIEEYNATVSRFYQTGQIVMITLQLSMSVIMLVYKAYLIVQNKMAHESLNLESNLNQQRIALVLLFQHLLWEQR